MYCNLCERDVGIEKVRPLFSSIVLLFMGAIVPLWPVTLPLFWGLAFLNYFLRTKKVCGICKDGNSLRYA